MSNLSEFIPLLRRISVRVCTLSRVVNILSVLVLVRCLESPHNCVHKSVQVRLLVPSIVP